MEENENEANLIRVDGLKAVESSEERFGLSQSISENRLHDPSTELARFFDASSHELIESIDDSSEIYVALAEYVCENLDSEGGLLWMANENDLEIEVAIDLDTDQIDTDAEIMLRMNELAYDTAKDLRCSIIVPEDFFDSEFRPESDESGFLEIENLATHCKQIYIPFIKNGRCEAVLAALVPSDSSWSTMDLIVITQRLELILVQHSNKIYSKNVEVKTEKLSRLKAFHENISRNLDEKKNAFDIVNELQAYIGTGRVTMCSFRGTTCKVKAVSGQSTFNRRSPVLVHIEKLSALAAKSTEQIFYPEDEERFPQRIRTRFEKYFEAADSRSIALLPLTEKQEPNSDPNDIAAVIRDRDSKLGKVVGVIAIEGLRESIDRDELLSTWEACEPMVASSVAKAHQHAGLFMMPVWRKLGMFADLYRGHRRNIAILVTCLILVAAFMLTFIQSDFQLRCKGVIQPAERSQIFADVDGTIGELLVDAGNEVKAGDLLLKLSSPQIESEYADVEGQLKESEAALKTVLHQRLSGSFESSSDSDSEDLFEKERLALMQESARYESKVKSLTKRLKLLAEKKSMLEVRSPIDGVIVTWNLKNRLAGRPVQNGDLLMVIAKPDSEWELDLRVPDKRAGYMLEAWNQKSESEIQKVTYCLASKPTEKRIGAVREIAQSANLDDKEGNVLRVYVDLNDHPIEVGMQARPGTEVIANVHAGRYSIGYCKVYEFIDWTRRVWFQYAG